MTDTTKLDVETEHCRFEVWVLNPDDLDVDDFDWSVAVIHRDDGPALRWMNSEGALISEEWFSDGRRHRMGDRPAVVYTSGAMWWYRSGLLHRDGDEPAYVSETGDISEVWHDGVRRQKPTKRSR